MSDLRDKVVEWMADNDKGYRAAATHFDISVDKTRYWARAARAKGELDRLDQAAATPASPSPSPSSPSSSSSSPSTRPELLEPSPMTSDDLAVIGTVEFYERMVQRLAFQVQLAEDRAATNSLASLMKQLSDARIKLDEARDRQRDLDAEGEVSAAEAQDRLLLLVEQMPTPFLELLRERVEETLGGPPLKLVEVEDEVEAS